MKSPQERVAALFAQRETAQLVLDLHEAEKTKQPSQEERMVRAWIIDEIERRLPAVSARIQGYFDAEEITGVTDERRYSQMIEDAIREEAAEEKK